MGDENEESGSEHRNEEKIVCPACGATEDEDCLYVFCEFDEY